MRRPPAVLTGLLLAAAAATAAFPALSGATTAPPAGDDRCCGPLVIGHRGASGYRPEHTLASYALAIAQGADYVEPDLVATSDGVLVARHENEISGTTDVADHPEFADRQTTKTIDGTEVTGWFTEDFTLEELKTLRAEERLPELRPENTLFDGEEEIPTFQQVIDLVSEVNATRAPEDHVGIAPETKHPSYFDGIGLSLEEPLVEVLVTNGYEGPDAKVMIQSFETANLRELAEKTDVPLAQLIADGGAPYDLVVAGSERTYADLATPEGLAEIAGYANAIGAHKNLVIPVGDDGSLGVPTSLVADAHAAGLIVVIWTVRQENQFLPPQLQVGDPADEAQPGYRGMVEAELRAFYQAGVDGVFTDNPDIAVAVREGLEPDLSANRTPS